MSEFGRWGTSPNPVQRSLVGHPVVAAAFVAGGIFMPLSIFFLVATQEVLLTIGVFVVGTIIGAITILLMNPKRSREEDFDLKALYMPWPEWMPGWVDSKTLSVEEHVRRSGKDKSRSTR